MILLNLLMKEQKLVLLLKLRCMEDAGDNFMIKEI